MNRELSLGRLRLDPIAVQHVAKRRIAPRQRDADVREEREASQEATMNSKAYWCFPTDEFLGRQCSRAPRELTPKHAGSHHEQPRAGFISDARPQVPVARADSDRIASEHTLVLRIGDQFDGRYDLGRQ